MTEPALSGIDVWRYLVDLTKPQPQLRGLPICPFLKQYMDRVDIRRGWQDIHKDCASFMDNKWEAIVYWQPGAHDVDQMVESLNDEFEDVEVLWMDPEATHPPLPIKDYTFRPATLVIVQNAHTLAQARSRLQKTIYYTFWREE